MTPGWDYAGRMRRAQDRLQTNGAAALLVGVGADLVYLTGYRAMPLERLTMLAVLPAGRPTLFAPRLEAISASACPAARSGALEVVAWDETDDAHVLVAARVTAPLEGRGPGRVLVSTGLWAMHVLGLQRALPGWELGLTDEVLRELRMVKEPAEVDLLRRAARAADRVVAQIAAGSLVGRTEADVGREVRERLVAEGHDTAEFAIVASGPNSASPHHEAGERVIEPGDPIVLDIGGSLDGYASDITRTLWVGGSSVAKGSNAPDPAFLGVFELVRAAQAAATRAVRPGVECEDLDGIARQVIADGGHGSAFVHRLGHGIGLEVHEAPYLVAGNREPLRPGMSFSIEPGIYLEGRWGLRLEDIVVCGEDGPIVLNEAPRDLSVVSG